MCECVRERVCVRERERVCVCVCVPIVRSVSCATSAGPSMYEKFASNCVVSFCVCVCVICV